jgi:hypothetical protein
LQKATFFIRFAFGLPSLRRSVGFGHDLRAALDSSKRLDEPHHRSR